MDANIDHVFQIDVHRPDLAHRRRTKYQATSTIDRFLVPILADKIETLLSCYLSPQFRVLDAGCGNQPFRTRIESVGCDYKSLDVQPNPCYTVDFVAALDTNLTERLASEHKFDVILCTEVLEHVADWNAAFANLAFLLKPGGKLLITCPHFFILHEEPYDFWRPTPHAITHFAIRHGLRVVHTENAGDAWDVLGTFLGACNVKPRSPTIGHKLISWFARKLKSCFWLLLHRHILQRLLILETPFYLCNIAIIEKPVELP